MVATKLQNFGGMIPAVDDLFLPDNAASYTENAWVYTGTIAGMHVPTLVYTCASASTSRVFRIPYKYADNILDSKWIEFENPDTDVVRAPVIGDTYERYYFASSSQAPFYNTKARLVAGSTNYLLGIPAPATAPTVVASGGSSSVTVSRSYLYTYVSAYGEEGQPSPPVTLTGKQDATFTVTLPSAPSGDTTNRNLTKRRIYRTITSSNGTASYFLVAELDLATLTYADTLSDTVVSGNAILASTTWAVPPSDLQGMISMPNGMIAGWRSNELWFCEPYRPHAWPAQYAIAVDYPIIGLGVIGQTLVVCTQGFPSQASGINPASMTLSKLSTYEPCTSRGSIVSAPEGVYYASPNGIILVGGGTVQNITRELITKDKWQSLTAVATLRAARVGTAYYAFGSRRVGSFSATTFNTDAFSQDDYSGAYRGFLLDPANQRVAFDPMTTTVPVASVTNDIWSGETFIVKNGQVLWLNVADPNPTHEVFKWRSKKFQLQNRRNLAAMRVWFKVPATAPALNPVRNTALNQTVDADRWGVVRVYADDRLVVTRELRSSGELFRIPSGFKSEYWQFELEARVEVTSVQIAADAKELQNV